MRGLVELSFLSFKKLMIFGIVGEGVGSAVCACHKVIVFVTRCSGDITEYLFTRYTSTFETIVQSILCITN